MKHQGALSLSFVLCVCFLLACGSSRQSTTYDDDSVDMDELLGEDDGFSASESTSDEAEVLRLLGITPAEEQTPEIVPISTTEPTSSETEMESELERLKDELAKREQRIEELRSQLTQREMEVSRLKQSPARRTGYPGSTLEPAFEFRSRYNQALSQFKLRNYQAALSGFQDLIANYPSNSLTDNCQYWIGECYYGLFNYNRALAEFDKVLGLANSNKHDDAQIMQGLCHIKMGDRGQARLVFEQLVTNYPNSEYKPLAQRYLRELQ